MIRKFFLFVSLTLSCHATQNLLTQAKEHKKNEEYASAINLYNQFIEKNPHDLTALFELGTCCLSIGMIDKAITIFDIILHAAPHSISAWYNKGYALKTSERLPEAIAIYEQIIAAHPDYDPAHLSLGFAYLANGDFERGWKQHERYLRKSGKYAQQLRELLETNTINDKTILLTYEGGLGDTIQYIRYAERLKKMGAQIIAMVQKPLIPLLSRCPYIDHLIPAQKEKPRYDAHATLMSLPAIFNDNEITFPNEIPYIFPDQKLVEKWKYYLSNDNNFKIGICWEADVHNDSSRLPIARRGIPLHYFEQLATIEGISWYSLQKCDGIEQLDTLSDTFKLIRFDDLDKHTGSFIDTSAIMENMNLIITVDTSIAHLAGALGRPTWLLHPYAVDWRWLASRTDSPWYPTMTIFKQNTPFDWQGVIDKVKKELLAKGK